MRFAWDVVAFVLGYLALGLPWTGFRGFVPPTAWSDSAEAPLLVVVCVMGGLGAVLLRRVIAASS